MKDTLKREPQKLISSNLDLDDLIKNLHDFDNSSDLYWAADTILDIDSSNQVAIDALNRLLDNCQDEWILWLTASRILYHEPNDEKAIQALVQLLYSSHHDIPWRAAESLGDVELGTKSAIEGLVGILQDINISQDLVHEWTLINAACSLTKIIQCDSFSYVVNRLKTNINYQLLVEDFSYYRWCRNILWDLTQDISYSDFFDAWHGFSSPMPNSSHSNWKSKL